MQQKVIVIISGVSYSVQKEGGGGQGVWWKSPSGVQDLRQTLPEAGIFCWWMPKFWCSGSKK